MNDPNIINNDKPFKPSTAIENIAKAVEEAPDTVDISCVLSGFGAKRFILAHSLLTEGLGMSPLEATAYLAVAGAEREIEKLSRLYAKVQQRSEQSA